MRASAEMKGFVKPRRHELVLEGKESPPSPKQNTNKEGRHYRLKKQQVQKRKLEYALHI